MPGPFKTPATSSLHRVKELAWESVLLVHPTQTEAPLLLWFGVEGVGGMQKGKGCMAAPGEVVFESSERQHGKADSINVPGPA